MENNIKTNYGVENTPVYYCNGIAVTPNYYDFQFTFSNHYINREEDEILTKVKLCKMFMSPEHAKVFSVMLSQNIIDYEKKFGEIKVPNEILNDDGEIK